jgi:hypothetical protein
MRILVAAQVLLSLHTLVVLTFSQRFQVTTLVEAEHIISSISSVAISFLAAPVVWKATKQQVTIG